MVFLPPYAPNLNLIERLWWFLKKTALWNEHYPTFADFKAAIDGCFRELGRLPRAAHLTAHGPLPFHRSTEIPTS
ncbi:MAG: transposase [Acetobacteraceae bacterium]